MNTDTNPVNPPAPTPSEWPVGRTRAVAVWVTFWVGYCLVRGIPFDRMTQLLMIISAALAFSIGVRGAKVRVVADWLPFFAFLYGYDYSRGAADTFGMPVQVESLYELELRLFGIQRQIPSLFLQRHLYVADHVQWWESFVALTYCSHFVAPWAIVGTLYVRNRDRWAQFARRMLTISFAALVTYFLVPAAPPWYAGRVGLTDHIERISTRGWGALHIPIAGQLVSLGQGVVNQVAAIPSLHAGTAFTIAMFFWPRANLWMRALFIVYPAVMVFALVYGGEHYVVDCSLGVLYAVLVEWGCRVWERRRAKPIPSVATT